MISPERESVVLPKVYAWFSAMLSQDTELMESLLSHGLPVDVSHPLQHTTALMEATRLGRAGMVQWLLDHGALSTQLCGLPLGTALHCALRRRHWDIAQILAHAMPHCGVVDAYGASPLHLLAMEAATHCREEIMLGLSALLIAKGCPPNALDHEGATALHHCVINDLLGLAQLILAHGANPNALIPDTRVSPLTIAALEKNLPMAKLLLAHGADPHHRTRDGSTPLAIYPALARVMSAAEASAQG